MHGLLIAEVSLVAERRRWGERASAVAAQELISCSSRALETVGDSSCNMQAQQLWRTGLAAPQHVESPQMFMHLAPPAISPNPYVEILTLDLIVFEGMASGRSLDHEGEAVMSRVSSLMENAPQSSLITSM